MTSERLTEREQLSQRLAEAAGQKSLSEYGKEDASEAPSLAVSDALEGSALLRELAEAGFSFNAIRLEFADIVVSDRVAVAIRSVQEFIEDMSDGSLFSSLAKMKHQFLHPILIVQGPPEGKGVEAGNAAVYDALGSLLSEFRMPMLSTTNTSETVAALRALYRQEAGRAAGGARNLQTTLDPDGRQLFLVQGLPNVSATLAQRLLERFGSVKGIADASPEQLMEVEGVGRVIAQGIHTVMRRKFGKEEVSNVG